MARLLSPIHPGETLREDVLKPLGMSVNQLARKPAVDASRLNDVVRGWRRTSAEFWMGRQADYDLRVARRVS
jgi:addiction module HigA family antidote